ncbi:MAG: helix-turn-helix domain-containing protein [Christensenellales bacterium]
MARKCGVSEGYIKDVEEGRRIIQDDQARRILKTLGTSQRNEAEFSLDEIAATVDLGTLSPGQARAAAQADAPKPAPKPASAEEQSGIWLDALSSVLQPVPIMNAGCDPIRQPAAWCRFRMAKSKALKPDARALFPGAG